MFRPLVGYVRYRCFVCLIEVLQMSHRCPTVVAKWSPNRQGTSYFFDVLTNLDFTFFRRSFCKTLHFLGGLFVKYYTF